MIALNEIISNKEKFELTYKSMGKKIKLDKIISLEEEFIKLDKKSNSLRSECNKLCAEIAELVNSKSDTSEAISKINNLDKGIIKLEKKSEKAMKKINKKLKKLPNLPLENNTLNLAVKTKNTEFSKEDLIRSINQFSEIEPVEQNYNGFINSIKKVVFKAENLPKIVLLKGSRKQNFVILCGINAIEILNNLQKTLTENAKYLTIKSIKTLKQESSKELYATLSDKSFVSIKYSGEFVSRENSIKLYDKNIDMTKFVNIIKITIK